MIPITVLTTVRNNGAAHPCIVVAPIVLAPPAPTMTAVQKTGNRVTTSRIALRISWTVRVRYQWCGRHPEMLRSPYGRLLSPCTAARGCSFAMSKTTASDVIQLPQELVSERYLPQRFSTISPALIRSLVGCFFWLMIPQDGLRRRGRPRRDDSWWPCRHVSWW
jgi:hypothetical protein